jgi:Flp pilus assembly pilin Flp
MKKLLKNQKGQGIMEYVIISSLIGICCLAAVKTFGDKVKDRIEVMQKQVEKIPSASSYGR